MLRELGERSNDFYPGYKIRGTSRRYHPSWPFLKRCGGFGLLGKGQKEPSRQGEGMDVEYHSEPRGQQ